MTTCLSFIPDVKCLAAPDAGVKLAEAEFGIEHHGTGTTGQSGLSVQKTNVVLCAIRGMGDAIVVAEAKRIASERGARDAMDHRSGAVLSLGLIRVDADVGADLEHGVCRTLFDAHDAVAAVEVPRARTQNGVQAEITGTFERGGSGRRSGGGVEEVAQRLAPSLGPIHYRQTGKG